MNNQKNVAKIQKVKLLTLLICLFVKRKLMKLKKISVLTTPAATNVGRQFPVFNSSFEKTTKYLASLDKLMQLISKEPCIYDLDIVK